MEPFISICHAIGKSWRAGVWVPRELTPKPGEILLSIVCIDKCAVVDNLLKIP